MIGQVAAVLGQALSISMGMQVGASNDKGINVMAIAVDKTISQPISLNVRS